MREGSREGSREEWREKEKSDGGREWGMELHVEFAFISLYKYFRTKNTDENILREYNFYYKIFSALVRSLLYTIAAAHISLYTW